MVATYKSLQLARRRGYGTFMNVELILYNASGKGCGPNTALYRRRKGRAIDHFRRCFDEFKSNLELGEWDLRASYIFGDDEE